MKRALAWATVVALTWISVPALSQAGPFYPSAVTVDPQYQNRRIVITARIDLWSNASGHPTATEAAAIALSIERVWNGYRFKCFDVIVRADIRAVGSRAAVRNTAVDVNLDYNILPIIFSTPANTVGGYAGGPQGSGATRPWLSDNPGDRVQTGRDGSSNFNQWDAAGEVAWAHEFGHILGLDDSYDASLRDRSSPRDGMPGDLMFSEERQFLAPETITRLIRRSGVVDESKIVCPMTMDVGPASINLLLTSIKDLTLHAYVCDYDPPSTDPAKAPRPMRFKGDGHINAEYLTQVLPGPISAQWNGDSVIDFTYEKPVTPTPILFDMSAGGGGVIEFSARFTFNEKMLLMSEGGLLLGGTPTWAVGLTLFPRFTDGASECP